MRDVTSVVADESKVPVTTLNVPVILKGVVKKRLLDLYGLLPVLSCRNL